MVEFDFWACQRPLTKHWGSGQVLERLEKMFGKVDTVYGKQDQVPNEYFAVDLNTGYDWNKLPFEDNSKGFGYWDPPYDHMYKHEGIEIWRCSIKLAILHTHIFPKSWLDGAKRIGMVAITMGPLKQIRCLQVFEKLPCSFHGAQHDNENGD